MDIAGGIDVVVEHIVLLAESFAQSFGPVAGLVGEVGAGVLGQAVGECGGVVAGEAEAEDAAPVVGYLDEADADLEFGKRSWVSGVELLPATTKLIAVVVED